MGNYYGSDVSSINHDILKGQWFIVSSPTSVSQLKEMQAYYREKSKVIYIDTDIDTANNRLIQRDGKKAAQKRINDEMQTPQALKAARDNADIVFKPSNSLDSDKIKFFDMVTSIIDAEI
jgi:dephospho-CoA kinase